MRVTTFLQQRPCFPLLHPCITRRAARRDGGAGGELDARLTEALRSLDEQREQLAQRLEKVIDLVDGALEGAAEKD